MYERKSSILNAHNKTKHIPFTTTHILNVYHLRHFCSMHIYLYAAADISTHILNGYLEQREKLKRRKEKTTRW